MKVICIFLIVIVIGATGCTLTTVPSVPMQTESPVVERNEETFVPPIIKKNEGQSVLDYIGTYAMDLEKSDKSGHINIRRSVRLTIKADNCITIGAGKIKRYELVSDFNDKGVAHFVERIVIDGKVYESECDMKLHPEGYLEVDGCYFKVNSKPNN